VDLSRAKYVVGSLVRLHGSSDDQLVKRIQEVPWFTDVGNKQLLPAAGLEAGITLFPLLALHWLSYATRPRYQNDLLDAYLHWALTRYIGFFDHLDEGRALPALMLSEAGQRIRGNQRRLTSEEMGIGFGALLANYWFKQTGAEGRPVSIVDVDAALDDRYIFAGGSRYPVRTVRDRRPDYLLIAPDPSSSRMYRVRALECKGTSSSVSYAVAQLASATEQLAGISVGGRIPRGLAVSTITRNDQMSYLAVDPAEDDEPSYLVNSNTIERSRGFRLEDNVRDVSPGSLTNASVRASWATLADFSGNLAALDRWAPSVMRQRLIREQRPRATFDTPYGPARGTSVTVELAGQRLNVTCALDATIDDQMVREPEALIDAQFAFAERVDARTDHTDTSATSVVSVGSSVYSATSDGSIFGLRLE
jgi:hypothetical protein